MTTSDRERFAGVLAALAASFGKVADEAMAEGYWLGLSDLEFEEFEQACGRAIRESEFFPKPVELRRLAGHMAADLRAVVAWDVVRMSIGRHGYMASIDFDDPLINAAVRNMGGWVRLCSMQSEEFAVWGRKEFERIYGALCETGTSAEACSYLPGGAEGHNMAKGHAVEAPRRVTCGLPPHKQSVLRGNTPSGSVLRLVGELAERKSTR